MGQEGELGLKSCSATSVCAGAGQLTFLGPSSFLCSGDSSNRTYLTGL